MKTGKCSAIHECWFYNDQASFRKISTSIKRAAMKRKYCDCRYTQCARFLVAHILGMSRVPASLFPDEFAEANINLEVIESSQDLNPAVIEDSLDLKAIFC